MKGLREDKLARDVRRTGDGARREDLPDLADGPRVRAVARLSQVAVRITSRDLRRLTLRALAGL